MQETGLTKLARLRRTVAMEKSMRALLTIGLALALAGCGGGEPPANKTAAAPKPRPSPKPGPMLGGVDLSKPIRASGSAPYWTLYVAPGTINYADAPGATPIDFFPVSPKLADRISTFSTQTADGRTVTITLAAAPCTAKAGTLPLSATLQIGARTVRGCAGPADRETNTPITPATPAAKAR